MSIILPLTKCRWFAHRKHHKTVGHWSVIIYIPDQPALAEYNEWVSTESVESFWRQAGGGVDYRIHTNSPPLSLAEHIELLQVLIQNVEGVSIPDPFTLNLSGDT